MKERILITSALPYANGPLHFGHIAGAYLPGDCYARFERMQGNNVLYVCGSDEYGIAITMSAELAKRTPKEHVDLFDQTNRDLFQRLNFSFDHYSRTTWEGHQPLVHQFFQDLLHNGYIEERTTNQLYSEVDQKFLADRYVVGTCPRCGYDQARGDECQECGASYEATDLKKPRSKMTNASLVLKPTKHWFLLLDRFKERLLKWLETKKWKPNVMNFVKGYIEDLHPRAITRDLRWGVPLPLPNSEGKVLYVWFDAPIGYLSASAEWALSKGEPELWKEYWCNPETKLVQFIGKDNLPFHAVIFPAMIMGQNANYHLVDELPANEFLRLEGRQFSKSDGWTIDLEDFFKSYTADQIRYVLAANAPETADAEFTWREFQLRCNQELVGKFGNLVNRTLTFIQSRAEGEVPPMGSLSEIDTQFLKEIQTISQQIAEHYRSFRLRLACQGIMELAQRGNIYFDAKKPWLAARQPETRADMQTTLACCLLCIKALAVTSSPIMPGTADKIWALLGQTDSLTQVGWKPALERPFTPGQKLPTPQILFKLIEEEQIVQELAKLHQMVKMNSQPSPSLPALKPPVTIDQVHLLDLRVGQVLKAEAVPKSEKLLKLEVDIGLETRTVVAGIKKGYSPEAIVGKKVVVVANLQPAKLMGIESQGMLLAGKADELLELASIQTLPNGAVVS